MKALYVDPSGIVRYNEFPEEPTIISILSMLGRHTAAEKERRVYQQALQAAKDSAVEFQDQKQVQDIILDNPLHDILPDTIHAFPPQYKVEVKWKNDKPSFGNGASMEKVAVINLKEVT